MGKRYYCDYCDKTMSCAPSIIKTHNNGLLHQQAKQEHFQKFKDPETILAEETQKKPCTRFPYGQCHFGSMCKFSHYSPESIQALRKYVETKHLASRLVEQPCFQDLYNKFETEKSALCSDDHTYLIDEGGVTHKLPWSHNPAIDRFGDGLPPSVRPISIEDFKNASFSEWG